MRVTERSDLQNGAEAQAPGGLDEFPYFQYCRNMDAGASLRCNVTPSQDGVLRGRTYQRDLLDKSILTDRFVEELKKQAREGCLLCSFETWDEEEWD